MICPTYQIHFGISSASSLGHACVSNFTRTILTQYVILCGFVTKPYHFLKHKHQRATNISTHRRCDWWLLPRRAKWLCRILRISGWCLGREIPHPFHAHKRQLCGANPKSIFTCIMMVIVCSSEDTEEYVFGNIYHVRRKTSDTRRWNRNELVLLSFILFSHILIGDALRNIDVFAFPIITWQPICSYVSSHCCSLI